VPDAPTTVPVLWLLTSTPYSVLLVGDACQLQRVPFDVPTILPDTPTATQSVASQQDTSFSVCEVPSD